MITYANFRKINEIKEVVKRGIPIIRKSIENILDIENTKVGNKKIRKRSLQQVMQESFFYGSNRFGNNFIA